MSRRVACVGLLVAWSACEVPNPAFRSIATAHDASQDVRPDAARPEPDGARPVDAAKDASTTKDAAAPLSLDDGLVGFWTFDEGSGTVALDRSGRGNHGALTELGAAAWDQGRSGGHAVDFAESLLVPRIEIPDSPSLDGITTGVTMAAWVWAASAPTDRWRMVLSRQSGDSDAERYGLGFNADVFGLYLTGEQLGLGPRLAVDVALSTWTHLAGTYDGAVARLYVNGKEIVAASLVTETLGADTTPLVIGNNRNASGFGEAWIGKLDDVLLYDRALAPHEIAALAAGAVPSVK